MKTLTLTTAAFFLALAAFAQNDQMLLQPEYSKFKIGLNFTPHGGYRILSIESGVSNSSIYQTIEKDRNESEIPRFGYSAGFAINYNFSKKVGIETGLQYASRGFTYQNDEVVPFIGNLPGIIGSFLPTELVIKYNWNYLEIPLRFVFTSGQKKVKFVASVGATAGLFMNAQQTTIIKYANGDESKTTDELTADFQQFVISPQLSLGAEYQISRHIQLRFEPIVRYAVQPIDDTPIRTNLVAAGLMVSGYFAF